MNRALRRVLSEIQRTEEKIEVWNKHLEELMVRKKQLEDEEILKSVRSMRLRSDELFAMLEGIQSGTISFCGVDGTLKRTDDFEEENKGGFMGTNQAANMGTKTKEERCLPQETAGNQEEDKDEDEN